MIVRALDSQGDWTYGKGKNDYKSGLLAIAQDIQCRVSSFLGDCFFATNEGIDYFNLLGAKNELALNLAIAATILNTDQVTGILQLGISLNANRLMTVQYRVQTALSLSLEDDFTYDLGTI